MFTPPPHQALSVVNPNSCLRPIREGAADGGGGGLPPSMAFSARDLEFVSKFTEEYDGDQLRQLVNALCPAILGQVTHSEERRWPSRHCSAIPHEADCLRPCPGAGQGGAAAGAGRGHTQRHGRNAECVTEQGAHRHLWCGGCPNRRSAHIPCPQVPKECPREATCTCWWSATPGWARASCCSRPRPPRPVGSTCAARRAARPG